MIVQNGNKTTLVYKVANKFEYIFLSSVQYIKEY